MSTKKYYSFYRNGRFLHGTAHHFVSLREAEKYGEYIHADEMKIKSTYENS